MEFDPDTESCDFKKHKHARHAPSNNMCGPKEKCIAVSGKNDVNESCLVQLCELSLGLSRCLLNVKSTTITKTCVIVLTVYQGHPNAVRSSCIRAVSQWLSLLTVRPCLKDGRALPSKTNISSTEYRINRASR
jgi:hypothetical protein